MKAELTLPYLFEREVEALVRGGVYPSKSDAVRDAFRFLFENKPMLRNTAAIELYRQGAVSIGKAAEIAGVTTIEFKDMLADRGIVRELSSRSEEELDEGVKRLIKRRG